MSTQTLTYLDAIEHLPAAGTLILTEVTWEEYEQLLDDLSNSPGVRVSYDRGRLEVTRPSSIHEMYKELVLSLAWLLADELGLPLESRGSTTFKEERSGRGAEPDTCFYVQNAVRIIGKGQIDLTVPPPDIVVEIDVAHDSTRKFHFYASLGVPELWRYDEQQFHLYLLTGGAYVEITSSLTFPVLTTDALSQFLEQSKTEGQTATRKSFREWLRIARKK